MSWGMCTTLVTAQSIIAAAKLREVECMEYRLARAETISDSYIITLVLLFKLDIMSAGLQRDNMEYSLARVVTGCGSKPLCWHCWPSSVLQRPGCGISLS